jgi:hypothetical protein
VENVMTLKVRMANWTAQAFLHYPITSEQMSDLSTHSEAIAGFGPITILLLPKMQNHCHLICNQNYETV